MNAQTIFKFRLDPRLRVAYAAHEAVLQAFKTIYKRQPVCDLFVGTEGNRDTQYSLVTARWKDVDKVDAIRDAQLIRTLADTVEFNVNA